MLTLGARRDWADPLDESLFWSGIDREILDAMIDEARDSFPDFRRYLRLKAKFLGTERLAWFDLFAPVGDAGGSWTWREAAAFIDEQFGSYSDRMAGLARQAFAERLDRRRAAAGQGRRGLLHVAARRRVAHPGQLLAQLRRRLDARPRAGTRLPQPERRRADTAATAKRR